MDIGERSRKVKERSLPWLLVPLHDAGAEHSENRLYVFKLALLPSCFPADSDSKEFACNTGDLGSMPGSGRSPGEGHGSPVQYSCLQNPHGQSSLVGYSPQGRKESDMTELP